MGMAREDMDLVLNESIKAAAHLLENRGEFFPFAVVRVSDSEIRHVETLGDEERPLSDDVIRILHEGLRAAVLKGEYRTTAIVSDVRLHDKVLGSCSDAIRVSIEDSEDPPVICYVPYEYENSLLRLGEIKAEKGESIIFPRGN
jgi:hypothetical protein